MSQHRHYQHQHPYQPPQLPLQQRSGGVELLPNPYPYEGTNSRPQNVYSPTTTARSIQHPLMSSGVTKGRTDATATIEAPLPTAYPPATRPNPYRTTENSAHPAWTIPSASSSSVSLGQGSTSFDYQGSMGDRRRLIGSMYSAHSTQPNNHNHNNGPIVSSSPTVHMHNAQNPRNGAWSPMATKASTLVSSSPSPRHSLSSLCSPDEKPSSIKNNGNKRSFWSRFPRKFRFRPKGVERPAKADSFGNKKAMFSNERSMNHWMKASLLLGSLSMTLLSFGENAVTPYIGLVLLMVCLLMLIYCTTIFHVRMEWLNMRRDDVLYYDRVAPTVIMIVIMAAFAYNAVVSITGEFTPSDFPKKKLKP
ncbi:hypothetical protein BGX28_002752 [Mortierella sp. GBA30]|nr:hypothetical protein BGX28_002752 [Mortierella sp. GBA30]